MRRRKVIGIGERREGERGGKALGEKEVEVEEEEEGMQR